MSPAAMSVDLARLPADEEKLRCLEERPLTQASIQNVLDALNYFRCLALHREKELARLAKCPTCGAVGLPQCTTVGCPDDPNAGDE